MTRSGNSRRGGKRVTDDRRERTEKLTTAVRLAVMLAELIMALVRDHLFGGAGPGRLR